MANTIKHKRGSGSNPSASDLAVGELAIRTDTGVVFTKKDDGSVAEISTDIVSDTTPQLGGNLDVNGKDITSASNGDVNLDPNGTGSVVFKGNSGSGGNGAGRFKLNCENNSHGITIQGPPHSAGADYTLTLPDDDGSSGQVLKTDGSGNLSWVAQPSAGLTNNSSNTGSLGVGTNALNSETSGTHNTAFGTDALDENTTGSDNVAVGAALVKNTTGGLNTAVGRSALHFNTTGDNNTACGNAAMQSNTSGENNVAVGHESLFSNTEGTRNTAIGKGAGYSRTTSSNSTFVGYRAGYFQTGSASTAIGDEALAGSSGNSSGGANNAVGFYAG